ncbi:MAG: RNA polymerase sigma factor [Bacteroidales bacterium]|nr:RNA polymerase sigma factor [Bacteroidales bacterium]
MMPHSRKIFAVAFRYLQRADEAEDLVQDVCIKLWQMRDELPSEERLLPYILTMARNLSIDRLRARHEYDVTATTDETDAPPPNDEPYIDNRVEDHDRLRRTMELIRQLPPDQQKVLRLKAMHDLDNDEITKLTGFQPDNVRQLLSRARRKLKELAQKNGII